MSDPGATTERLSPADVELIRKNSRLRARCSVHVTFLQGLLSRMKDPTAAELIRDYLARDRKEPLE